MGLFDKIRGKSSEPAQQAGDLSVQQQEQDLKELRSSLEAAYQRPDAEQLQRDIGETADRFDDVRQRFEEKASGDKRYEEPRKILEAALEQPDHIQRGADLMSLISACDKAMSKSGVDQGLLKDTKDAAKKLLELGKKEADIAQQEVKARQASRRLASKRAQQAQNEQKKQAEANQRREKQEEDITKSINSTAANQQAQGLRARDGSARQGAFAEGAEYETADEKTETTLADANQPSGGGRNSSERVGEAGRGADGTPRDGFDPGVDPEEATATAGTSAEPTPQDDEFLEFMDGERRRRVRKRRPDGSLVSLEEILGEGVGIDQVNILEFIQDPVLLKFFDIAMNRQLGEIRQRYGEDALILFTVTELARAVIARGLRDRGFSDLGVPPSLRRARTPTEEAIAEGCRDALWNFMN